jgi:hypothetical protein
MLPREMHVIRCTKDLRRKAQKALRTGDLCAATGHLLWAMRIWRETLHVILQTDYYEWVDTWWSNHWYKLDNLVSEMEATALAQRIDRLWEQLGHPEMGHYEADAKKQYDWLWLEKYDYYRDDIYRTIL